MTDRLSLDPLVRSGVKTSANTYKSERHFLDFIANGQSLWERLGRRRDSVSILCAEYAPAETLKAANRLLLTEAAVIPNHRRSLFICSECGDIGCGAITLNVNRDGDAIVWKDFGFQNNYETEIDFAGYENVGPFTFDGTEYENTIRDGLRLLNTMRK